MYDRTYLDWLILGSSVPCVQAPLLKKTGNQQWSVAFLVLFRLETVPQIQIFKRAEG